MWCRGPESLRAARLARSQTTYRPELNVQCSSNRTSTRTVPLAAHVTSRHLSGYYSIDILEAQVIRLGVRRRAPRTYHLKASTTAICTAGAPGARVAPNHPTRAGRAGNLKKCLGARAMRRGQGKEAPCFRLDLTGASGPHMSALHYRPPAAGGPLLRSECLAWVSQPAIMLQPRAVMRTGDTTR